MASKKLLKLILIPAQRLPWHSHLELLVEAHWVLVAMLKMQEKMQQARWCKQFYHVTSTSDCLNQSKQSPYADDYFLKLTAIGRAFKSSLFLLGISV